VTLAWTVLAFGGIYPAVLLLPAVACLAVALSFGSGLLRHSPTIELDRWLLVVLAAMAMQLAPLPRPLVQHLSPHAIDVERAFALIPPGGARPLTVATHDTIAAFLLVSGTWLLFVTARRTFADGGVRTVARFLAVTSLALSGVALAQNATAKGLMYWRYAPVHDGPYPFGPFINRNHFATWAMMAVPLCVGYLAAHAAAHPHLAPAHRHIRSPGWRARLLAALDGRALMLAAASLLLMVATAASLSRSGLLGLAAAVLCTGILVNRGVRNTSGPSPGATPYFGVLAVAGLLGILTEVGPGAIAARFGASGVALADRLAIWHDTLPLLRDFWLTGTGIGTFQSAMAVYQRSKPEVIFNQAHNQYLQLAAEGGLLVAIPVWLAVSSFVRAAWGRLQVDRSPMYFIRAGACAGLVGVAVQSFWETGLTIPANAALAVVLAAIVVHVPSRATAPER
jgi:hypothetical protein